MPTHTGVSDMFDPLAKPMTIEYTIVNPTIALLLFGCSPSELTAAGSQSVSDVVKHMNSVMIIRL